MRRRGIIRGGLKVRSINMKLHDALRKICSESGNIAIQKKSLVYQLADLHAFDEYPETREAIKAMTAGGYAKELYRLSLRKDPDDYLKYTYSVCDALVRKKDIDEEIAAYAVCSVSFALGITENAPEPGEETPWPDAGGNMDGCPLDDGPAETERLLSQTRVEAEQGDAEAQYRLGCLYYRGAGVKQDYSEALAWYRKSADQGNPDAQYRLGCMYYKGTGVQKDFSEAFRWYLKSADQGNQYAQCFLGIMYCYGQGVKQDYSEALSWTRKAAEQGNCDAEHNLGIIYRDGLGIAPDYGEALRWYKRAADKGNHDAENCLGEMYSEGQGVQQDYAEAARWYRKSADSGDPAGENSLGNMYYHEALPSCRGSGA